jgi:hypothetical protein
MGESQGESTRDHAEFPVSVRRALLDYFQEQRITAADIWRRFAQKEGYGSHADHATRIESRDGGAYMDAMVKEIRRTQEAAARRGTYTTPRLDALQFAAAALVTMPDSDFRVALEYAIGEAIAVAGLHYAGDTYDPGDEIRHHVNTLFEKRGVPYRLDTEDCLAFTGDRALHELVTEPALEAPADPRLLGVRAEFENALHKLDRGGPRDLEGRDRGEPQGGRGP